MIPIESHISNKHIPSIHQFTTRFPPPALLMPSKNARHFCRPRRSFQTARPLPTLPGRIGEIRPNPAPKDVEKPWFPEEFPKIRMMGKHHIYMII